MVSGSALSDLLQAISRTACDLMGFDFCAVALPDETRTLLRFEGSHGVSEQYIAQFNSINPIRIADAADSAPSSQAFLSGNADDAPGRFTNDYRVARGAVDLAAVRGLPDGVHLPADLGVVGLLLQHEDTDELDRHVRTILGPLTSHDRQAGAELFATLGRLLENDFNAAATAAEMFIHKNTVVQRRHRIEGLLHRDLGCTWDLVEVAAAWRIEEMLRAASRKATGPA